MTMSKTILIVDDKLSARETLKGLLTGQNYHLVLAGDGYEALEKVAELEPDLILLDVMMPGLDGFEVCRRLKGEAKWQHIPIILVTALDGTEDLARGLEAGADDFLSKPVNGLELHARVRSLLRIKEQFDALQAAIELREDMSAMIVHDMRSPLMSIWWLNELMKEKLGGIEGVSDDRLREIDELGERINQQVNRLNAFANDMLMLAKLQSGEPNLNYSEVDIRELVLETQQDHLGMAERTKAKLEVVFLPDEPPVIRVDRNLWRRVLDNLITNALKYSPPEGRVRIAVDCSETAGSKRESKLQLTVADEGPGIAEEYRESIFDKYKVAGLKKKEVPQVGLGLAFCKQVVEAHGGRIWVTDNHPNGSVFTIEI